MAQKLTKLKKPKTIWMIVQQGGSSREMYLHTFEKRSQAMSYRRRTLKIYNCSMPIETTETIDKVFDAVQAAVNAAVDMV